MWIRSLLGAATLVCLATAGGCSDDAEPAGGGEVRPHQETAHERRPPPGLRDEPEAPGEPPRTHAPSDLLGPPALTVGQWVRYKLTWREGAESYLTYSVVGAEGGAFWLEIDDRRRGARKVFKLLIEIGDRTDASTLQVRRLVSHDGQERSEVPDRLVQSFQPVFRQLLGVLFSDWEGREREEVTVPAGTFQGAYKGEQEMELTGARLVADVWHHPDVPVTGMVRFVARGEMRHQMDLVAFGETGARSALP